MDFVPYVFPRAAHFIAYRPLLQARAGLQRAGNTIISQIQLLPVTIVTWHY